MARISLREALLVLAMGQHQLGNKDEARITFAAALEWRERQMRLDPLTDNRFQALRAEAEAMLKKTKEKE